MNCHTASWLRACNSLSSRVACVWVGLFAPTKSPVNTDLCSDSNSLCIFVLSFNKHAGVGFFLGLQSAVKTQAIYVGYRCDHHTCPFSVFEEHWSIIPCVWMSEWWCIFPLAIGQIAVKIWCCCICGPVAWVLSWFIDALLCCFADALLCYFAEVLIGTSWLSGHVIVASKFWLDWLVVCFSQIVRSKSSGWSHLSLILFEIS